MTLPLVVGAPVVLLAGPAFAEGMTETTVTLPAPSAVYGQEVHATATVTAYPSPPVSEGTVQFYVGQEGVSEVPWPVGGAVPLNASGTASSPALTTDDGTPLEVTATLYEVSAVYLGTAAYDPSPTGTAANGLLITKAGASVAVLPTSTQLVADVTGAFPGGIQANSIKPDGAVEFKVNGVVVDSRDVVNGRATLNHILPAGPQTVTATYTGDGHYTGASEQLVRNDPTLQARVLSMFPKSKSGWYHTPVDIWFICKPAGSELVEECPADLSLNQSGKDQSVTRTIRAADGGSATLTISGIDIDRDKPVIKVNGRSCTATDKLSGVKGKCHMKIAKDGSYRAIANDKAGNRAVKRGILD